MAIRKSVRKTRKSVRKTRKSVRKTRKSVRKTRKSVGGGRGSRKQVKKRSQRQRNKPRKNRSKKRGGSLENDILGEINGPNPNKKFDSEKCMDGDYPFNVEVGCDQNSATSLGKGFGPCYFQSGKCINEATYEFNNCNDNYTADEKADCEKIVLLRQKNVSKMLDAHKIKEELSKLTPETLPGVIKEGNNVTNGGLGLDSDPSVNLDEPFVPLGIRSEANTLTLGDIQNASEDDIAKTQQVIDLIAYKKYMKSETFKDLIDEKIQSLSGQESDSDEITGGQSGGKRWYHKKTLILFLIAPVLAVVYLRNKAQNLKEELERQKEELEIQKEKLEKQEELERQNKKLKKQNRKLRKKT